MARSNEIIDSQQQRTSDGKTVDMLTMADGRILFVDQNAMNKFYEKPSLEIFAKMNQETKLRIAAFLLEGEVSEGFLIGGIPIDDKKYANFRAQQLPQYLRSLSSFDGADLYQSLWQFLGAGYSQEYTENGQRKLTEIFWKASQGNMDLARQQVCEALASVNENRVSSDFEKEFEWQQRHGVWATLNRIIREKPELYNTQCHILGVLGGKTFSVRDLFKTYVPKTAAELESLQTDRRPTKVSIQKGFNPIVAPSNSACTEKQVRSYFHDAIETLMTTKSSSRYLMSINKGYCVLNGMIEKNAKNEFVYRANYGGMNPLDKSYSIRFFNLSEAVTLVMATQSKVPAPPAETPGAKAASKEGGAEIPPAQNIGNAIYSPFGSR